jgi:hypothetical protein
MTEKEQSTLPIYCEHFQKTHNFEQITEQEASVVLCDCIVNDTKYDDVGGAGFPLGC